MRIQLSYPALAIILLCGYCKPIGEKHSPDSPMANSPVKFSITGERATNGIRRSTQHVPALCYHQVRDWGSNDSKTARPYIIPVSTFKAHMKLLHDSGYHTILPGQLVNYLLHGNALPEKPVLLTFDDGSASQYLHALPELDKYGFKAVFFIMTVTLDRPAYMSKKQIKSLSDEGHIIGCHTWDHDKVTQYNDNDWNIQLTLPTHILEQITGKPVDCFSYPFGAWDQRAIEQLQKHGYTTAFQLAGMQNKKAPQYTIRRIIADSRWSASQLNEAIRKESGSGLFTAEPGSVKKDNPHLDTLQFNKLQLHLCHNKPTAKWPVKTPYPLNGAILPFKRIVAFYGNFYSKEMGILGALPPDQMLSQLQKEVKKWEQADPQLPVQPAIHYIAVTAQCNPGRDKKYRLRMPAGEIEKALTIAKKINALVFLDIQVGHSSLREELPELERYLRLPGVHLGIDPEYSMKGGEVPCSKIGTYDASDINYASEFLAGLVSRYDLPPKILVVHRFTKAMVTNYRNIMIRWEVQIVINMDGFGFPAKKADSYRIAVANEPVQFAGFKLFYKNDQRTAPFRLMTPDEVISLYPSPVYI